MWPLRVLIEDVRILIISTVFDVRLLASDSVIYPKSWASNNCVCNSPADPLAIAKKWVNSPFVSRSNPSLMFEGIDNADRLI